MTLQPEQRRQQQPTKDEQIEALKAEVKKVREVLDIMCRFIAENGRKK